MSRLTRAGTAEPVSRGQILRHERGQGNIYFSCSADHVQDWQPYPVGLYSSCYMCDHTYIHTFEDMLCDTSQAMASTNAKVFLTRIKKATSIDSDDGMIVVAYPRPAFSVTKRTDHAPISFDQQAQVSQGHTSSRNKEN